MSNPDDSPEVCFHADPETYRSRSGARCRLCLGLVGPRTHVHRWASSTDFGGITLLVGEMVPVQGAA